MSRTKQHVLTISSGDTRDRETLQVAEIAARETLSPVERLEIALHPWVGFVIMPLFAFANAGVPLSLDGIGSSVALAIFVGFVLGKPVLLYGPVPVCKAMLSHEGKYRLHTYIRPQSWRTVSGP